MPNIDFYNTRGKLVSRFNMNLRLVTSSNSFRKCLTKNSYLYGLGQGSFAAGPASSINIGTAVYDITNGEVPANIGNMPLKCLIFQDDIAKMTRTMFPSQSLW